MFGVGAECRPSGGGKVAIGRGITRRRLGNAVGKKATIERQPTQPGDVPFTCADISKAQRMLGYSPKVKIEEGIPRFVEWFTRNELKAS